EERTLGVVVHPEPEVPVDGDVVGAARHYSGGQYRPDFTAERHPAGAVTGEVERFDAELVSCQHQLAGGGIQDRQREHAVEPVERALAPLLPGGQHHLGVTGGTELVTAGSQLLAQFAVVVDRAVVDDYVS